MSNFNTISINQTVSDEVQDCYGAWSGYCGPKDGYFGFNEYVNNTEAMMTDYPEHQVTIKKITAHHELLKVVDLYKKNNQLIPEDVINSFATTLWDNYGSSFFFGTSSLEFRSNYVNFSNLVKSCMIRLITSIPNKFSLPEGERFEGSSAYNFWLKIHNMNAMMVMKIQFIPNREKYYHVNGHCVISKIPESMSFEQIASKAGRIMNNLSYDDYSLTPEDLYQSYLLDEKAFCQRLLKKFIFTDDAKGMFSGITPRADLLSPLPVKVRNLILMGIAIANNSSLSLPGDISETEEYMSIDSLDDVYCLQNFISFSSWRTTTEIHPMITEFLSNRSSAAVSVA